jgi:translation initiation factor 2 beta subunit (eIF-2beta)/eIF-5
MPERTCPICKSHEAKPLVRSSGPRGYWLWLRCRACGIDYSVDLRVEEAEDA